MNPFKTWMTSDGRILQKFERRLRKRSKLDTVPDYTRVLVLPLDDTEALKKRVRESINYCMDGENDFGTCLTLSAESVLQVITASTSKGRK